MKRTWTALLLALLLFAAGCSKGEGTTVLLPAGTGQPTPTDPPKLVILTDQYTATTAMDAPVWQEIQRRCGVQLELVAVDGSATDVAEALLASGKLPDIISLQDRTACARLADAGVLVDLREVDNANLRQMQGEAWDCLGYGAADGPVYYLPIQPSRQHALVPESGFQLQHRVVQELGYPVIRTLADYEVALKTYLERHPETNGQPTLGLTFCLDTQGMGLVNTVQSAAVRAAGGWGFDGEWWVDEETGRAIWSTCVPETRPYYAWLNALYHDGLIDPEALTQTYQAYVDKLTQARVLGLTTFEWEYLVANEALDLAGIGEYAYGMYPVTYSADLPYRDMAWCIPLSQGGRGVAATSSAGAAFLEAFADVDVQKLWFWGIETQDYRLQGGVPTLEEDAWWDRNEVDYAERRGVGLYEFILPSYGVGARDEDGLLIRPQDASFVRYFLSDTQLDVLDGYGVDTPADFYPQDFAPRRSAGEVWPMDVEDAAYQDILLQCRKLDQTYIAALIQADPADFDALYQEWQDKLQEAGAERLGDYQTGRIGKTNRDSQG